MLYDKIKNLYTFYITDPFYSSKGPFKMTSQIATGRDVSFGGLLLINYESITLQFDLKI